MTTEDKKTNEEKTTELKDKDQKDPKELTDKTGQKETKSSSASDTADKTTGEKKETQDNKEKQPQKEKTDKPAKKGKKRKQIRQIAHGRAYIQATYNNTIITLTDLNGNVLAWSSAGQNGFKGPKKATPFAAGIIVKDAVEKSKAYGLKNVNVFIKGIGSGRESAVRSLNANGLNVLSIKDITPIPHNGCRKRKPRRI